MTRYEQIEKNGLKTRDRKYLLKYLSGEKLTPMQTIRAKCYECMGGFQDGKVDCGIDTCPNYPYMPFNPYRTIGNRNLTAKSRGEIRERLEKGRKAQKKKTQ